MIRNFLASIIAALSLVTSVYSATPAQLGYPWAPYQTSGGISFGPQGKKFIGTKNATCTTGTNIVGFVDDWFGNATESLRWECDGTWTFLSPVNLARFQGYTLANLLAIANDPVNPGQIYRVTDSIGGLWIDTGTAWRPLNGGVIDVTQAPFNAVCDGVTDDSAAIQAALNAMDTWSGGTGGTVILPPAVCAIATGLTVPRNVAIKGHGPFASSLLTTAAITAITLSGAGSEWDMVTEGFMINCNTGTGTNGINNGSKAMTTYRNIRITGCSGTGIIVNSWGVTLDTVFSDNNAIGADLTAGTTSGANKAVIRSGSYSNNSSSGIRLTSSDTFACNGVIITGNMFDQNAIGIVVLGNLAFDPDSIFITHNRFESNTNLAIRIDDSSFGSVIAFNTFDAGAAIPYIIEIGAGDVKVIGNHFSSFATAAIHLVNPDARRTAIAMNSVFGANPLLADGNPTRLMTHYDSFTGDNIVKRIKTIEGTAIATTDFSISAGWGDTASVSAASGYDQRFRFTVTSAGVGQLANPTITFNYVDGSWTTTPFIIVARSAGNQLTVANTWTMSDTQIVITFNGTPIAGETYTFVVIVMG